MFLLGQIIGVIGFVLAVYSMLIKNDRKMKNYFGVCTVVVALSYYLIGAFAGSVSMLVSSARNFVAAYSSKSKSLYILFMLITLVCGLYTYEKISDILPIIGAMVATTALFMFEGISMRLLIISACVLWMAYDIINSAMGPAILQTFNIGACLYAIRGIKVLKQESEPQL
jgi:hypothetical protein